MRRPHISIAGLMVAVAVVAVDVAVCRRLYLDPVDGDLEMFYALGILPMASLLVLFGAFAVPDRRRGGRLAPFVFGFEAVGWTVLLLFISWYSLGRFTVDRYRFPIQVAIMRPFIPALDQAPPWVWVYFANGIGSLVLTAPQLLLALFGGWLARRLKLTIRFERG